jgi:two-component system chemotaxis sensor kinase CheA
MDEKFLRTLRATFQVEAAEHLQALGTGLLELEKTADPAAQQAIIETVFRAAHSLKGAARAIDLTEIETQCQLLEELFAAWKRRERLPDPATLDRAHRVLDTMVQTLTATATATATTATTATTTATVTADRAGQPAAPPAATALSVESDTVRIAVSSLDERLLEAEEMLAVKGGNDQRVLELSALANRFAEWRKEWGRIQQRTRGDPILGDFLDWNQDYLRALEEKVVGLRRTAEQERLLVGKLIDDLLENSKKLLMLPLATLSTLLSKLVRDLTRDQGKEAELTIRGEEVTIDKRILEELKDPLIHLLRNCVDHGIETPEQRRRAGKPARAAITVAVSPVNGNQVEISVSDDGAGIDVEEVRAAATRRGVALPEAAQKGGESAALALVFETDVSTSPMITQLSGRGLGLAIVREKAEKLGGRVAIESRRGAGTTIRMTVPLTLATFRGVLIECGRRLFIVPTVQVERVTRFRSQDVQTVEGRRTLALNGRAVALVDLAEVLQLPALRAADAPAATPVLILGAGEQRLAIAVDAVLDEREVLVKRFGKPLSRVRNIAGATILGSGELAPILNVSDLLKSARSGGSVPRVSAQAPTAQAKKILIVEDSITSRMLLKGILESAGYDTKTAVDGIDAFTALRAERFDGVVSDVEMPRMNGFDLTARIRADRTLAQLPVVLVTALESRDDRERGIDVGANAYLVKSNLDQSNLLDALRRLA